MHKKPYHISLSIIAQALNIQLSVNTIVPSTCTCALKFILSYPYIASRGIGYGVETYRIDGNDVLAIHKVTSHARRICVEEGRPVLIEAMTYRVGHHSTSDDSSKYRPVDEVKTWNLTNCPIKRLQGLLIGKEVWSKKFDEELIKQVL